MNSIGINPSEIGPSDISRGRHDLQDRGQFAQDERGDQNANETSKLVSSLLGPTAPNALSIGRLRLSEPLERTRLLLPVWVCGQTLLNSVALANGGSPATSSGQAGERLRFCAFLSAGFKAAPALLKKALTS